MMNYNKTLWQKLFVLWLGFIIVLTSCSTPPTNSVRIEAKADFKSTEFKISKPFSTKAAVTEIPVTSAGMTIGTKVSGSFNMLDIVTNTQSVDSWSGTNITSNIQVSPTGLVLNANYINGPDTHFVSIYVDTPVSSLKVGGSISGSIRPGSPCGAGSQRVRSWGFGSQRYPLKSGSVTMTISSTGSVTASVSGITGDLGYSLNAANQCVGGRTKLIDGSLTFTGSITIPTIFVTAAPSADGNSVNMTVTPNTADGWTLKVLPGGTGSCLSSSTVLPTFTGTGVQTRAWSVTGVPNGNYTLEAYYNKYPTVKETTSVTVNNPLKSETLEIASEGESFNIKSYYSTRPYTLRISGAPSSTSCGEQPYSEVRAGLTGNQTVSLADKPNGTYTAEVSFDDCPDGAKSATLEIRKTGNLTVTASPNPLYLSSGATSVKVDISSDNPLLKWASPELSLTCQAGPASKDYSVPLQEGSYDINASYTDGSGSAKTTVQVLACGQYGAACSGNSDCCSANCQADLHGNKTCNDPVPLPTPTPTPLPTATPTPPIDITPSPTATPCSGIGCPTPTPDPTPTPCIKGFSTLAIGVGGCKDPKPDKTPKPVPSPSPSDKACDVSTINEIVNETTSILENIDKLDEETEKLDNYLADLIDAYEPEISGIKSDIATTISNINGIRNEISSSYEIIAKHEKEKGQCVAAALKEDKILSDALKNGFKFSSKAAPIIGSIGLIIDGIVFVNDIYTEYQIAQNISNIRNTRAKINHLQNLTNAIRRSTRPRRSAHFQDNCNNGYDAHHVIPFSYRTRLADAHDILRRCGINIDDFTDNGVCLAQNFHRPTGQGNGWHTITGYVEPINNLVIDAYNLDGTDPDRVRGDCDAVRCLIRALRNALLNGYTNFSNVRFEPNNGCSLIDRNTNRVIGAG